MRIIWGRLLTKPTPEFRILLIKHSRINLLHFSIQCIKCFLKKRYKQDIQLRHPSTRPPTETIKFGLAFDLTDVFHILPFQSLQLTLGCLQHCARSLAGEYALAISLDFLTIYDRVDCTLRLPYRVDARQSNASHQTFDISLDELSSLRRY